MPVAILALVVLVALAALVYWSPRRVTVFEFERGLRYRRGRVVGTLPARGPLGGGRIGFLTKGGNLPLVGAVPGAGGAHSSGRGGGTDAGAQPPSRESP